MSEQTDTGGIDLTILDHFAAQALTASDWSTWTVGTSDEQHLKLAKRCYDIAVMMVAEKRRREAQP